MLYFFLIGTSLVPLLIGNEQTKIFAPIILFFYVFFVAGLFYRARDVFNFISPISLIFFYSSLSLLLGSWGYKNGYVMVKQDEIAFLEWRQMDVSLSLMMISLSVMILTDNYFQRKMKGIFQSRQIEINRPLMFSGLILAPFFFFSLDLDLLGGQGDLSIIPKTIVGIFIIISSQRIEKKFIRWLIYLSLIIGFATFSIDDKREAIFLIFPIIYLELARKKINMTPIFIFWFLCIIASLLGLVLIMSVARGYGEFGIFTTLTDAIPFVKEYIKSDSFIPGFFANIEVNYFFFHALNSIELVINDPQNVSFGSTIVKPLFILIPRSIAEWKPDSIIGLYTSLHSPDIRAIGGSWPISVFSEIFWNFYFSAPLFVIIFSLGLVKFQAAMLKSLYVNDNYKLAFLLFCYMNLITLARGSGFDQYVVFIILAGWFVLMCKFFSFISKYDLVTKSKRNHEFNNNKRVKRK